MQLRWFLHTFMLLFLSLPGAHASIEYYTDWDDVQCVAMDGEILWAGTPSGLVEWNTGTGKHRTYSILDGLPDHSIHDMSIDKTGLIYLATRHRGVIRFDGERFESIESSASHMGSIEHLHDCVGWGKRWPDG